MADQPQASAKAGVDSQKEIDSLRKQLEEAQGALAESQASAKAGVDKKAVKSAYNKGANYYDLAKQFLGFESDEAVEKIRQIIED